MLLTRLRVLGGNASPRPRRSSSWVSTPASRRSQARSSVPSCRRRRCRSSPGCAERRAERGAVARSAQFRQQARIGGRDAPARRRQRRIRRRGSNSDGGAAVFGRREVARERRACLEQDRVARLRRVQRRLKIVPGVDGECRCERRVRNQQNATQRQSDRSESQQGTPKRRETCDRLLRKGCARSAIGRFPRDFSLRGVVTRAVTCLTTRLYCRMCPVATETCGFGAVTSYARVFVSDTTRERAVSK